MYALYLIMCVYAYVYMFVYYDLSKLVCLEL
jgi:hypothetical protein